MRVHILDGSINKDSPNLRLRYQITRGYWFPVVLAEQILREMDVEVCFYSTLNSDCFDCDTLLISSRYHDHLFGTAHDPVRRAHTIEELSGRVPRIVWFDLRDSSGTTQFEVLPYVDLYAKQYLLRDMTAYSRVMYGGRPFTEFEHQIFGVEDSTKAGETNNQEFDFTPLNPVYKHKVVVAWDLSYRWNFDLPMLVPDQRLQLLPIFERLRQPESIWLDTLTKRSIGLSAMLGATCYCRETVASQRRRAVEILRRRVDLQIQLEPLPYASYIAALRNSRVVLSCFGNGEVCYREHEAWTAGSAVIMPDMEHIRTYPNRYRRHHTYHPINWTLEDLIAGVERLEQDADYRIYLAETGQRVLRGMFEADGLVTFARRFVSIAQGKRPEPVDEIASFPGIAPDGAD